MSNLFILVSVLFIVTCVDSYIIDPGPLVIATKGEVWPKPQVQNKSDDFFVIRPHLFKFQVTDGTCQTLQNAIERYWKIVNIEGSRLTTQIQNLPHDKSKKRNRLEQNFINYLDVLNVTLKGTCRDDEYPNSDMDEQYSLTVNKDEASLKGDTIWAILRGLETFSQLLYIGDDYVSLRINATSIVDYPRFKYRGLLLDTARHFIPVDKIYTTIDALAYNKFNVFHWHIVDDQSFPYVSRKFPELSEYGAYNPHSLVYSQTDVKNVIEYARERGVRVIPEFDTPGHTRSWGISHPELLTACYENDKKTGQLGPLDPSKNSTYSFLNELFGEVRDVFSDEYIHLGGDEVGFECWESNPDIIEFMKLKNFTDSEKLENYYVQNVINIVDNLGAKSVVWQEVFTNNVQLPDQTVVHVWISPYDATLYDIVSSGKQAILSACWYLDHLETWANGNWISFYDCEPTSFLENSTEKALIIGGEACMWSESVNEYNVIPRVWPRASATAERLWSDESVNDSQEAAKRLEEHTCRMNRRGIAAVPPNGPGFCN